MRMWDGGDIAAGTDDDDHDDDDDDDRGGDGHTADGAGMLLLLLWSVGWDGGGGVRNGHGGQSSLKSNARTLMEMDESGMVTQLHGDRYITCGGFVCGCARNCQVQGACTRRRARQRYRKKQKMTSRIQ